MKIIQPGYVETQELIDDLDNALDEANKVTGKKNISKKK